MYLLQAVWPWLWDVNHNIPLEKHKPLMKSFQNILYAESPIDAANKYKKGLKTMNFLNGQNMCIIIGVIKKSGVLEIVLPGDASVIIIVKLQSDFIKITF